MNARKLVILLPLTGKLFLYRYCYGDIPTLISTNEILSVRFVSDSSGSSTGFNISYGSSNVCFIFRCHCSPFKLLYFAAKSSCDNLNCANNGTCVPKSHVNEPYCLCGENFTGRTCERKKFFIDHQSLQLLVSAADKFISSVPSFLRDQSMQIKPMSKQWNLCAEQSIIFLFMRGAVLRRPLSELR